MLGGIAGLNFDGAKIIDCYNVGTIIRNSTVFEFCGGIVWGNAGTVSNCYNVGTISGNVYDPEDLCWLPGSARLREPVS